MPGGEGGAEAGAEVGYFGEVAGDHDQLGAVEVAAGAGAAVGADGDRPGQLVVGRGDVLAVHAQLLQHASTEAEMAGPGVGHLRRVLREASVAERL
jgi:hypothetical protein